MIKETEHYVQVPINNADGGNKITICKGLPHNQINIETSDGGAFIDVLPRELEIIRDAINRVLESNREKTE